MPPAPTFVPWRVSAVEGAMTTLAASVRSARGKLTAVVKHNGRSGHTGKVGAGGTGMEWAWQEFGLNGH